MAILSVQAPDFWLDANKVRTAIAPREWLSVMGPRMEVTVSLATSMAQPLLSRGLSFPSPISGWALIDTGASSTCIDENVAKQLNLPVVDVVTTSTPSDPAAQRNVYPINIQAASMGINLDAPRAIGAELSTQGLLLLIGRDFLAATILVFNGFAGQWSLSV